MESTKLTLNEIAEQIKSHQPEHGRARRTAVLVPLIEIDNRLEVLFEVRSLELQWQPGDICFPGGHYEDCDESMQHTVVRETSEELGIAFEKIEVLGKIGAFDSPLGMEVHIFAGALCNTDEFCLDRHEVHECFSVPLQWFLENEPEKAVIEHGTRPGDNFPFELLEGYSDGWKIRRKYPVLFYDYNGRIIWGLTAEVLQRFLAVIKLASSHF